MHHLFIAIAITYIIIGVIVGNYYEYNGENNVVCFLAAAFWPVVLVKKLYDVFGNKESRDSFKEEVKEIWERL